MNSFPKIFHLGDRSIQNIFEDNVEITEKLDGSQISWMLTSKGLKIRSKGSMIYDKTHYLREIKENDLFYPAIQVIFKLYEDKKLVENFQYFGETFYKPKHNVLAYNSIPKNHIALFGILDDASLPYNWSMLNKIANYFDIGVVSLLYQGFCRKENKSAWIEETFLNIESALGGPKIEGIVVKRFIDYFVGDKLFPIMAGKYVSESFKEIASSNWSKENTSKGKWIDFKESFRTEARWEKAVQFLREQNQLTGSPKDIGPLIHRVSQDITEEEKENIKEFLWREFGKVLLRESTHGLPEWYKGRLLKELI